jgi:hypothetical protein
MVGLAFHASTCRYHPLTQPTRLKRSPRGDPPVPRSDAGVTFPMQRGADVHVRDRWGRNALQDAIDNCHYSVTSRLAAQVLDWVLHTKQ